MDWLNIAVWAVIGAFVGAFWAAAIALLMLPFVMGTLDTIGKLNGCENLNPADCAAYAESR